jgi:hypothetical protein
VLIPNNFRQASHKEAIEEAPASRKEWSSTRSWASQQFNWVEKEKAAASCRNIPQTESNMLS